VRDTSRWSEVWVSERLEALVREVLELDPDWISVYLELFRRARTDLGFRRKIEERQETLVPANRARIEEGQRTGEFRGDLGAREIGLLANLVLNGLALQRASGDDLPPVGLVLGLLEDTIGGRARPRRPSRTRA
jgi:hypothetical protein